MKINVAYIVIFLLFTGIVHGQELPDVKNITTPNNLIFFDDTTRIKVKKKKATDTGASSGKVKLAGKTISKVSRIGPHPDATTVIKTFPGIVSGGDLDARYFVRGGYSSEVISIIDNQEIVQPYFFGKSRSAINPYLVESAVLYPGGFPVKYGNCLTGVLDIKQKTGHFEKTTSEFNILNNEFAFIGGGPVIPGKSSWLFSARRNSLEPSFEGALNQSIDGKLFFRLDETNNLILNYHLYHDDLEQSTIDGDSFDSENVKNYAHAQLNSIWSSTLSSRTGISYAFSGSWLNSGSEVSYKKINRSNSVNLSGDIEFRPEKQHLLSTGIDYDHSSTRQSTIGTMRTDPDYPLSVTRDIEERNNLPFNSFGIYIQDDYEIIPEHLAANIGVRYNYISYKSNNSSQSLDPRMALYFGNQDNIRVTVSLGKYSYFNLPAINGSIAGLLPETAVHYGLGYDQRIASCYRFKAELFHKQYDDLINLVKDAGTGEIIGADNTKKGISTGLEFFIQREASPDWDGWISYTLSRVKYKSDGLQYYADQDQRHTLNVIGTWHVNPRLDIIGKWIISTGRPYTDINGATYDDNRAIYVPVKEVLNSSRFPDYNNLSVICEYKYSYNKDNAIYLGFSNLLSNNNVYSYYWNSDYTEKYSVGLSGIQMLMGIKIIY